MPGPSDWLARLAGRGLVLAGVSWWNRRAVAGLLAPFDQRPRFVAGIPEGIDRARREGRALIAWAAKLDAGLEARATDAGVDLVRIEDGFLRSVGLGAGLAAGASYALDVSGIYYDATRPSDLETMLAHDTLTGEETERGRLIRETIVRHRLSKYNLAGHASDLPPVHGRERILVPGQVAADAAIRTTISATVDLTAANVNLELLRAVRGRNPRAFIVYKPHPDVAAGLRPGQVGEAEVARLADAVVPKADILTLIQSCDRMETLSSLAGFEALLRGKPVTVHGAPFYAGWGLSQDLTPLERRGRARTVDELVFIALARYCRHVDPQTFIPISCETLIERLALLGSRPNYRALAGARTRLSWLGRRLGL